MGGEGLGVGWNACSTVKNKKALYNFFFNNFPELFVLPPRNNFPNLADKRRISRIWANLLLPALFSSPGTPNCSVPRKCFWPSAKESEDEKERIKKKKKLNQDEKKNIIIYFSLAFVIEWRKFCFSFQHLWWAEEKENLKSVKFISIRSDGN